MMVNNTAERRQHKRLNIKEGAFAVLRTKTTDLNRIKEMSMGEIAVSVFKSNAIKIGQIKDASIGGLSFCYDDCSGESKIPMQLDILVANDNFFLSNISFKIISDFKVFQQPPNDIFEKRQIRMQFQKMDNGKQIMLEQFINKQSKSSLP